MEPKNLNTIQKCLWIFKKTLIYYGEILLCSLFHDALPISFQHAPLDILLEPIFKRYPSSPTVVLGDHFVVDGFANFATEMKPIKCSIREWYRSPGPVEMRLIPGFKFCHGLPHVWYPVGIGDAAKLVEVDEVHVPVEGVRPGLGHQVADQLGLHGSVDLPVGKVTEVVLLVLEAVHLGQLLQDEPKVHRAGLGHPTEE